MREVLRSSEEHGILVLTDSKERGESMAKDDTKKIEGGDAERFTADVDSNLHLEWLDPRVMKANPLNWRLHPDIQKEALRGSLRRVGWAGAILMNTTTEHIIDGHARVEDAIEQGSVKVPVLVGTWTEDQEEFILATFDPLSALAEVDVLKLGELLPKVQADNAALKTVLDEMAAMASTTDAAFAFHRRGTVERASYISLLISVRQHQTIEAAIEHVTRQYQCARGDAIEKICQSYVDLHKKEMEEAGLLDVPELAAEAMTAIEVDTEAELAAALAGMADSEPLRGTQRTEEPDGAMRVEIPRKGQHA